MTQDFVISTNTTMAQDFFRQKLKVGLFQSIEVKVTSEFQMEHLFPFVLSPVRMYHKMINIRFAVTKYVQYAVATTV